MKFLIIFAAFFIFTVESESCGNLSQSANQWPWTVSIFSNASNMVLCQGSIISNNQILTAGHCLQHRNPSSIQVYPGFVSHRWTDHHQLVWQVEQINLHPDMKLTSRGRFINGGFVASMAIHADLAIATLKQEIQFNDIITSICLPIDDSIENIDIHGSYSGWNMNLKNIESLNATIKAIGDAEIFEVAVDEERVDFVTGTGFYSRLNSSWMIIGLMTMRESENGTEMNKFISIHKYVNWITNLTQSTSVSVSTSSSYSNVETSTPSTYSSSTQTSSSQLSTISAENSPSHSSGNPSSVESSSQISSTTEISSTSFSSTSQNLNASRNRQRAVDSTTESRTTSNVRSSIMENEKASNSEQSKAPATASSTAATTLPENFKTTANSSQSVVSPNKQTTTRPVSITTTEQDKVSSIQETTSSYSNKLVVGELTSLPIEQSTLTSNNTQETPSNTEKTKQSQTELSTPKSSDTQTSTSISQPIDKSTLSAIIASSTQPTNKQSSSTKYKSENGQTTVIQVATKTFLETTSSTQKSTLPIQDSIQTTLDASSLAPSSELPNTTVSQILTTLSKNLLSTKAPLAENYTQEKETTSETTIKSTEALTSQSSAIPKSTETAQSSSSDTFTTTESPISSQSSLVSTPSMTSTTPQNLINTVETKVETSTPLVSTSTDLSKTETTIVKKETTKAIENPKESTVSDIRTTTGLNTSIDEIVEIPKVIASNLQAVYNRSIVPRLPEGRDLKDFSNNVSQAIESLSTIANRLPSFILTTLATTTRNPIEDDIITKTSLKSLNSSLNITTETSLSVMNSTESNDNSTTTINSEDVIIGGFEFTPAMVITGVCIASLLVLFIIFGLLSLSKPVAHPH